DSGLCHQRHPVGDDPVAAFSDVLVDQRRLRRECGAVSTSSISRDEPISCDVPICRDGPTTGSSDSGESSTN
ncbi:MAG TPA: hypothetical protein PKJ61_06310, partial [Propionicimonas sp.]|nr:hypothetical protein [Propionicimonas sp.]